MRLLFAIGLFLGASKALAACPSDVDFIINNVTIAPYTDVFSTGIDEFDMVSDGRNGVIITHVGEAQSVTMRSLVSVFRPITFKLQDGVEYCVDSAVALPGRIEFQGGRVTVKIQTGTVIKK